MPDEAITALAGLVASFLSGLLGIGGGLVLTPLLLYLPVLVGGSVIPVKIITGLTIVQAISGGLLGALRHRAYGNVAMSLVRTMAPPISVASLAGSLMLLSPVGAEASEWDERHCDRRLASVIAVVLGFFGGMVGIGGIAFIIAALVYLMHVPPRVAIGTSLAVGLFAATAAFIGKAATAQIDPPLAAIVFVAALVASPVGATVSVRTQPRVLLVSLSVVVALSAIRIALTAITGT